MSKLSRRALAAYASEQLLAGRPAQFVAKHLAAALIDAGKTDEVEFLLGDIAAELQSQRVLAVTKSTSAFSLTPDLRQSIKEQIQKATSTKAVLLQEEIDPKVLGGIRLETSTQVWDSTINRKLADLKEAF